MASFFLDLFRGDFYVFKPNILTEASGVTSVQGFNGIVTLDTDNIPQGTNLNNYYDRYYTHVQSSASTTWNITHSFGKNPSVTLVDNSGIGIEGQITYNSISSITVNYNQATAGNAYLN